MLERLSPLGDGQVTGRIKASAPQSSQPFSTVGMASVHELPTTPPPDVLDALDRASRVLAELDRKNVTLGLHHDVDAGQVRVTVDHGGFGGTSEVDR
jgi:hypothetical protein